MGWFEFGWTRGLKNRCCKYALQKWLGKYLKHSVEMEKMTCNLDGTSSLCLVEQLLDEKSISEHLEQCNIPLELTDGYVGKISIQIPFSKLHAENVVMEIRNLELTLRPKVREEQMSTDMLDSMFSSFASSCTSMSTSMMMAKECLKDESPKEEKEEPASTLKGLEEVAQAIESVLNRIRISLIDTIIRLEYLPKGSEKGAAVEVSIAKLEYYDDQSTESNQPVDKEGHIRQDAAAVIFKNIVANGVKLFSEGFFESRSREEKDVEEFEDPPESPTVEAEGDHVKMQLHLSENEVPQGSGQSSNVQPIAVLMGTQHIKLKIKQQDDLARPSLEIDATFGSLDVHLSPRQLHQTIEVLQSLSFPAMCDEKKLKRRHRMHTVNKPMGPEDFARIERELKAQGLKDIHGEDRGTRLGHTLSADITEPVHFQPMDASMFHSAFSAHSSSTLESSTYSNSSEYSSRLGYSKGKGPRQASSGSEEACTELLKIKMKLNFFTCKLLQQDPPATPADALDPKSGKSSEQKLLEMADLYFSRIKNIYASVDIAEPLPKLREHFAQACPVDHISLLCKPLTVECCQQTDSRHSTFRLCASVGQAELVEVLCDRSSPTHQFFSMSLPPTQPLPPEFYEILVFDLASQNSDGPFVRVQVVHQSKRNIRHLGAVPGPKTDIHIDLAPCSVELDFTIVDRLHTLLHPHPLAEHKTSTVDASIYQSCHATLHPASMVETALSSDMRTSITVTAAKAEVILRFPIPDLSNKKEKPWWKRLLRKELLILELSEVKVTTVLRQHQQCSEWNIYCLGGIGKFQESAAHEAVAFMMVGAERLGGEDFADADRPCVTIKLYPPSTPSILEQTIREDPVSHFDSLNGGAFRDIKKPEISVFSQKRDIQNNEEKMMPGNKSELKDFEDHVLNNCLKLIDISIPNATLQLPQKEFLELLYNRIVNDLGLWEPQAPEPLGVDSNSAMYMTTSGPWDLHLVEQMMAGQPVYFQQCQPSAADGSDSDSDMSMGQYESMTDTRRKNRDKSAVSSNQSRICFRLNVKKGKLNARVQGKRQEVNLSEDLPDYHGDQPPRPTGEFEVRLEDCTLLLASCFNGDPLLTYLYVRSNRAALYHQGCLDNPLEPLILSAADLNAPTRLPCVVQASHPGVNMKSDTADDKDMLTVSLKIHQNMDKKVKDCLVSLAVHGGTLFHQFTEARYHWLNQLMELFDLQDEDIIGYEPLKVLTELHVHIWSCAIVYKPLYMRYGTVLTFQSFSITSNVLADSPVAVLRFMVEDAAMYMTDKPNGVLINLIKDYVRIADLDMFELSLMTSDGRDPKYPKVELSGEVTKLRLYTCVDSYRVFAELLNYIASDGDLLGDSGPDMCDSGELCSARRGSATSIMTASVCSSSRSESPVQAYTERVHDLMAEAMRESSEEARGSTEVTTEEDSSSEIEEEEEEEEGAVGGEGLTIFYTKDTKEDCYGSDSESVTFSMDSRTSRKHATKTKDASERKSKRLPDVERDLGATKKKTHERTDSDEFCIIDVPGLGASLQDGQPKVRMLTSTPIQIIDEYFKIPQGKTDVLKSPDHFPPPVYKYTLREMTLIWHMYGGRDFSSSTKSKTTIKSDKDLLNRRFARQICKPSKDRYGWSDRGLDRYGWKGPDRDKGWNGCDLDILMELHLTKVRLQHEVFAEDKEQASRQSLFIHEVEIRDRLASSKIHKFLYQYTSEELPKPTYTNMLIIKALQTRPEVKSNPELQECSLKVSVQPLRLNIDQDALFFLKWFFSELTGDTTEATVSTATSASRPIPATQRQSWGSGGTPSSSPRHACTIDPPPTMQLGQSLTDTSGPDQVKATVQFDELSEQTETASIIGSESPSTSTAAPLYIKNFVFSPEVLIRIDYHGKKVDTEHGTFLGLVVGLAQLNCSEIKLKKLNHRRGLRGFDKLAQFVLREWLEDIRNTQLTAILGGVGPMHSLMQIVQGIQNLVWMPVEQYRKDGRVVRGLQRGTKSFLTLTVMSTLELTNRLVVSIKWAAEKGYTMTSPVRQSGPPRYRLKQPSDLREGLANACTVVTEGFKHTASAIYEDYHVGQTQRGWSGAFGAIVRHMPSTFLQPIIITSDATSNIIGGMRNQLLPDRRREEEEKWKPEDDKEEELKSLTYAAN